MAQLKTKATRSSVSAFLKGVSDAARRRDCHTLLAIMTEATGEKPRMWGPTLIGFGSYHYKYASGHQGVVALTGFSPRRDALALYFCHGLNQHAASLERLGRFKAGKGCLYVKRLSDVDLGVLTQMIRESIRHTSGHRRPES